MRKILLTIFAIVSQANTLEVEENAIVVPNTFDCSSPETKVSFIFIIKTLLENKLSFALHNLIFQISHVDLFSTGTCDIKEEVYKLEEIQTQVITESNIMSILLNGARQSMISKYLYN